MRMMKLALGGMTAALGMAAGAVEVDSGTVKATFDAGGELVRLVTAKGVDLLEMRVARPEPLWKVGLVRPGDFTAETNVTAALAKGVRMSAADGALRIVYSDVGPVREAVVEVRADRADGKLRWRLTATPAEGWALYRTDFPQMRLTESIGRTGADDAVLAGLGHAGIKRNPSAPRWKRSWSREERVSGWQRRHTGGRQPGPLAAQFLTFWDATAGFYTAAEDGKGWTKEVNFTYAELGFLFGWSRFSYAEKTDAQDYDVVMATFDGDGTRQVDWYDAADLYKKWALTQHWCRTPLKYRADLPAWAKDAPAMLAFYTDWIERPELIRRFFTDYWTKTFPGVPTATALVGWEKHGEWIGIDYFPMHPSDEVTSATFRDIKKYGAHPWPWPSGHYWSLLRNPNGDGTFAMDDRERFRATGGPELCCLARDGRVDEDRKTPWLQGGSRACLCPGSAKARDFWTRNVCLELVRRGAEMVQSDQDTGAHVPECWSAKHGHAPGEGLWKTADMYEQFRSAIAECRKLEPGFVMTFEEPNEHFNDLLFIQDHRNCRFATGSLFDWEWADVFGYLYHEYVAPFQSDVVNGNSFWWTHAAVEGHVPYAARLVPSDCFGARPAIANGGFEEVSSARGRERLVRWDGPMNQHVDRAEKHGGAASLRLERRVGQSPLVAQSFGKGCDFLRPGAKLRLTAWAKAEKAAKGDGLTVVFLDANNKGFGSVSFGFPQPGADWRQMGGEFTVPENAVQARLLCWALGDTRVWLDDLELQVVAKDGSSKPAEARTRQDYMRFLRRWVNLYHGEGRDWLAHGRHVRPLRYSCERVAYDFDFRGEGRSKTDMPSVFHAAYESLDGRRAYVFGNATEKPQPVAYLEDGVWKRLTLKPAELRIVRAAEGAVEFHSSADGTYRWFETMMKTADGAELYTYGVVPTNGVRWPVIVTRTPYDGKSFKGAEAWAKAESGRIRRGYASVCQQCRGSARSTGVRIPYVDERRDSLAMLEFVRKLPCYNGEIFVKGASYVSSVHWAYLDDCPADVKGAALGVQCANRYPIVMHNGFAKLGLNVGWYRSQYKSNVPGFARHAEVSPAEIPLCDFSKRYFGDGREGPLPGLDDILAHPRPEDPFWQTPGGAGGEYRRAFTDSKIPILMTTGWFDIYADSLCEQWREASPERKANCALVIDAFDHGGGRAGEATNAASVVHFPNGSRQDPGVGVNCLDWFDYVRGGKPPKGVNVGGVRWYGLWENEWHESKEIPAGERTVTLAVKGAAERGYRYDPRNPAKFPLGCGLGFGKMSRMPPADFRPDVLTYLFDPAAETTDVAGRMKVALRVKSDCADTAFYVRVSVKKAGTDAFYGLREDIKELTWDDGDYTPGTVRTLRFTLGDIAFRLGKGDVLRLDVSSANAAMFAPHTNVKGLQAYVREPKVAENAVLSAGSTLTLPVRAGR